MQSNHTPTSASCAETSDAGNVSGQIARCQREIAEAKDYLRDGGKDIEGACLAIHDWSIEEQLIRAEFAALRRGCGR